MDAPGRPEYERLAVNRCPWCARDYVDSMVHGVPGQITCRCGSAVSYATYVKYRTPKVRQERKRKEPDLAERQALAMAIASACLDLQEEPSA